MFRTHDDTRYDFPTSLFSHNEHYWRAVDIEINTHILMITYFHGDEGQQVVGNLMVATTKMIEQGLAIPNIDVTNLTLLTLQRDGLAGWVSHNITALEVGQSVESAKDDPDCQSTVLRLAKDSGEIFYIVDEVVSTRSKNAEFTPLFQLQTSA